MFLLSEFCNGLLLLQIMDILKQCGGKLNPEAIRLLMKYLFVKKDRHDVFLYKIIDKLYKDKTHRIGYVECTVLCGLLFRRHYRLKKLGILKLGIPMFSSSAFIKMPFGGMERVNIKSCNYFSDNGFLIFRCMI